MKLAYRACDNTGQEVQDVIEAVDTDDATRQLRRNGLFVIEIAAPQDEQLSVRKTSIRKVRKGRRLKDMTVFSRQLSVLVLSGTPLVEALGALEEQTSPGRFREVIRSVRLRVEEGDSLADAMRTHPEYFEGVDCSLIAAGESSGTLVTMLDRLAAYKRKQLHVRNTVIGAMIYPALVLFVATVVLSLLLLVVVPRFGDLFDALGAPLPVSTRALIVLGQFLQAYWWIPLLLAAGVVLSLRTYLSTPAGVRARDTALLRLPQFGRIARSFAVARITRLLGVLVEGRVPLLEALRLARSSITNIHYRELIAKAEDKVSRGEPMHSAFLHTDLISPTVCGAIRSGENSGRLGLLLLHVADFLDDENEIILRSLTSILEPVILIIMGLLVGTVAVSMFMPLFDLTSMTYGAGG